jgi:L-Ala-D/L-Glu epimerase
MKIIGIEIIPITVSFQRTTQTSVTVIGGGLGGAGLDKEIIKIFTDEGILGLGEITGGDPIFSGETQDTVVSIIRDVIGPNILINEDPFNIDKIVDRMDSMVWGHNLTKSAIDCALFDIMGKSLRTPIYKLLGGLYHDKIPLRYCIGINPPDKMAEEAGLAMQAGFKGIKFKGGLDPQQDVEAFAKIRKTIGPGPKICIDVNAAYTVKTALRAIKLMEEYGPIEMEQPLRLFDLEGMALLRKAASVPIGACENAVTIYEIMKVIRMEAADFFNFMICRSGGFYRGKQIISMIDTAGLKCVGVDPMGLGIQLAANAHFGASTDKLDPPSGYGMGLFGLTGQFNTKNMDGRDIVLKTPKVENGFLEVPEGPGLGVELNEETMKRYLSARKSPILIGSK